MSYSIREVQQPQDESPVQEEDFSDPLAEYKAWIEEYESRQHPPPKWGADLEDWMRYVHDQADLSED